MTDSTLKRSIFSQGPASHVKKKPTRDAAEGEEFFTIADIEDGLGLSGRHGVKKWAESQGILREARYTIPGRHKIKRMAYVDREGLVAIVLHFRASQGKAELRQVEDLLEKVGQGKERELRKLRKLMGG